MSRRLGSWDSYDRHAEVREARKYRYHKPGDDPVFFVIGMIAVIVVIATVSANAGEILHHVPGWAHAFGGYVSDRWHEAMVNLKTSRDAHTANHK